MIRKIMNIWSNSDVQEAGKKFKKILLENKRFGNHPPTKRFLDRTGTDYTSQKKLVIE